MSEDDRVALACMAFGWMLLTWALAVSGVPGVIYYPATWGLGFILVGWFFKNLDG